MIPNICGAVTRKGTHCTREVEPGATRCTFHGARTPLGLRAARERLIAMAEPAFHVLMELMEDPEAEDEVKLKAAIAVLDRAGFGPKSTVVLDQRKDELAALSDAELIARMQELLRFQQGPGVIDVTPLEAPFGEVAQLPAPQEIPSDDPGEDPPNLEDSPWIERVGGGEDH